MYQSKTTKMEVKNMVRTQSKVEAILRDYIGEDEHRPKRKVKKNDEEE